MVASRLRTCARPAGLLHAVCVAALVLATVPAIEAVTVVAYKGWEYRTRDGASPTTWGTSGCEDNWVALPSGFEIAPDTTDSRTVAGNYEWNTCCLVLSNGDSWVGQCGGNSSANSDCGGGQLLQSGSNYKVNGCALRILVRRACAAGSYQGPTLITYTQAETATCTSCPAG